MPNPSLDEYLAQAQRGINYLGLMAPGFLSKQFTGTAFGVGTAGGAAPGANMSGDIFTPTFGRKVWHALNNQVRFFNAIPRVVWGNTAGWRVRTDRGAGRSRPITEVGALPGIDVSNIETVQSLPRFVGTTFGVSERALQIALLEGGAGDLMAFELEASQIDHIKEINEELLAGSAYLASIGAATTFTVPAAVAFNFKIGDTVSQWDVSVPQYDRVAGTAVTAVDTATGIVTIATGTAFADGDVAFIRSRAGFSSLDDILQRDYDQSVVAQRTIGPGGGASQVRVYNLAGNPINAVLTATQRVRGQWNALANANPYNSGVGRDLTLQLLDNVIRDIRINGGEPKLIIMGHDQYYRLERLLQPQQRYLDYEEYQVGVGSERTFPGTRAGMLLSKYQNIAILPEVNCPRSVDTADTVIGTNIYVLDTDYINIGIMSPTVFVENRDYFAANALVRRGLFFTLGELRCHNIWVQGKIADLLE